MHNISVTDKLNFKKTALIGFGFMAVSLAWAMYSANVPLLLEKHINNSVLIGLIMSIDNVLAVVMQPVIGALSDKTHTRRGRRLPYILIGMPVSAVLFSFIPLSTSLALLIGVIILYNLSMSVWRSPVVALMPDVTPSKLRSQANGVINLMGGIGTIVALLGGGVLINLTNGIQLPFVLVTVVTLAAWAVLFFFVREPQQPPATEAEDEDGAVSAEAPRETRGERISLLLLLLAIFFWFLGFNAIETFFTLYATNSLHIEQGNASISLAFFAVSFGVFAVPAGFLGTRFGRKRCIVVGLSMCVLLFAAMFFITNMAAIRVLMVAGGFFWACVNTNSLPMVVEIGHTSHIGRYTGYYYFFSQVASIAAPSLFGCVRELTGSYGTLFLFAGACCLLALLCIVFVRHGEAASPAAV